VVVLAARNAYKLALTTSAIEAAVPDAHLERLVVDLSDLGSVRKAAANLDRIGAIDVLINNAGIMAVPFRLTADGLESQMATNHFGGFLLTGLLLPRLIASGNGRVVVQSSNAHRSARSAPVADPHSVKAASYRRWATYCETKLANLLFTFELDRRARAADLPVKALAAHPGFTTTNLMPGFRGQGGSAILNAAMSALGQPASAGAEPMLMAATADLPGSTYCGPNGRGEIRGSPTVVTASPLANSREDQRRLWEISEAVVGLSYPHDL